MHSAINGSVGVSLPAMAHAMIETELRGRNEMAERFRLANSGGGLRVELPAIYREWYLEGGQVSYKPETRTLRIYPRPQDAKGKRVRLGKSVRNGLSQMVFKSSPSRLPHFGVVDVTLDRGQVDPGARVLVLVLPQGELPAVRERHKTSKPTARSAGITRPQLRDALAVVNQFIAQNEGFEPVIKDRVVGGTMLEEF